MARILLIDDDEQVRAFLSHVLKQAGYEVVEASNGRKALELFRQVAPELVLTDILMPESDGLEVIAWIVDQHPTTRVIAMTGGRGENNFLRSAEIVGAHRILAKPFGPDRLLRVVQEELQPEMIEQH
jgi:CheY-like chemotaxis protein